MSEDHQAEAGPPPKPIEYRDDMTVRELQKAIGMWAHSKGWWDGFPGGDVSNAIAHGVQDGFLVELPQTEVNYIAAKLALVHSEVSEALEALRIGDLGMRTRTGLAGVDDPTDDKPEGLETELADTIIRLLDLAGALGMDMGRTIAIKMKYNTTRPHKHGGKAL